MRISDWSSDGCSSDLFAAVMQPAGDLQRLPLLFVEPEILVRPRLRIAGGARQHQRQLRPALTMPAGVGRFGVDGAGHQPDEGIEQHLEIGSASCRARECQYWKFTGVSES